MKKITIVNKIKKIIDLIKTRQIKRIFINIIKTFTKEKETIKLLNIYEENLVYDYLDHKLKDKFKLDKCNSVTSGTSNIVWFCWLQGIESAPDLIKVCYNSLVENNKNKDIRLVTSDNIFELITFPQFIIDKWKSGIISNTHFSDLIRLELLYQYGGVWSDATVFYTKPIPNYVYAKKLFFFSPLVIGKNIASNNFLYSEKNNLALKKLRDLLFQHWNKKNILEHYCIYQILYSLIKNYNKESEYMDMVKVSGVPYHILQSVLFEEYAEDKYKVLSEQSFAHKLSYKFDNKLFELPNTFYKKIINSNLVKNHYENI